MKRSKFSDSQIMDAVKRVEAGLGVPDDLPPPCRTKVMEQSPLISENSGHETIQIYR